ncbi:MAG: hypothetical protein JWN07_3491, partial [Hyphomicrobiales bacterium]|nr:hypothetical protein [Hyphomicrobiales bacterium]
KDILSRVLALRDDEIDDLGRAGVIKGDA